jgi:hypothetical protein
MMSFKIYSLRSNISSPPTIKVLRKVRKITIIVEVMLVPLQNPFSSHQSILNPSRKAPKVTLNQRRNTLNSQQLRHKLWTIEIQQLPQIKLLNSKQTHPKSSQRSQKHLLQIPLLRVCQLIWTNKNNRIITNKSQQASK